LSELNHKRVAVIGAGIAGLAAAYRLREIAASRELPLEVMLFERDRALGSACETIRRDGFVIETGADSILSEKPWALDLIKRLGIESELIGTDERYRKTYVVRAGRLVEIPEGFSLLAPTRFWPVFKSPIFSPLGKLRMALEPIIPRRREPGDESLGAFVRRRLGREVLDRVAQPLAGGIYTADPEMLSLQATMPRFLEMERRYGSLYRGMREAARNRPQDSKGTSGARWSLFVSFRGGLRMLTDALASRLGECARGGVEVTGLTRGIRDKRWLLSLRGGEAVEADAVVLAAPAYVAANLLKPHSIEVARLLEAIGYSSAATVHLGYHRNDFPNLPESFGFVVPIKEGRKIIACTFSSKKFEGRAADGMVLCRIFLGGALQSQMMELDDAAMIAAAREELAALLQVRAEPVMTHVRRWPNSMPQYAVGHLERVAEIERLVKSIRGLALAGSAYRGVGIPDCIHSGELAAESMIEYVARSASEPAKAPR
jgi:protoporphyrinogen/coproporphyrinogen III oxidase